MVAKKTEPTAGNNMQKYESYKLAWERIAASIENGFPIEAICIEESIMTDRLLSFVNAYLKPKIDNERALGYVVSRIERKIQDETIAKDVKTLRSILDKAMKWWKLRNKIVHSIAKSDAGGCPEISACNFLEEAMNCAKDGECLASEVLSWHRKELQAHRKNCNNKNCKTCHP